MSDGIVLIEKLLGYAKENLQLSEYDLSVKRNFLRTFLKVADKTSGTKSAVGLGEGESYLSLKTRLSEFLLQTKVCQEKDIDEYVGFIFTLLMPLPSVVNKKFLSLREKFGANAACDYLYNLSVKSGSVNGEGFNPPLREYFSADGAAVFIGNVSGSARCVVESGNICSLCNEREVFLTAGDVFGILRSIILKLNDENWSMRYVNSFDKTRECIVSYGEHAATKSVGETVVAMLDFIEYLPEYSAQLMHTAQVANHSYFAAYTTKLTDFLKTPLFTATQDACPDVEISLFNRGSSIIRLQSFNRNTLEYLAQQIIEKWQEYSDKSVCVYGKGADGVLHNFLSLNATFSNDNRYTLDIALVAEKLEGDYDNVEKDVFDQKLDDYSVFGRFVLSDDFERASDAIVEVLTKKRAVSGEVEKDDPLYGYEQVVESLINEYGYFKDAQKALCEVKSRLSDRLLQALNKKSVFLNDDEGTRAFKRFLATVGLR